MTDAERIAPKGPVLRAELDQAIQHIAQLEAALRDAQMHKDDPDYPLLHLPCNNRMAQLEAELAEERAKIYAHDLGPLCCKKCDRSHPHGCLLPLTAERDEAREHTRIIAAWDAQAIAAITQHRDQMMAERDEARREVTMLVMEESDAARIAKVAAERDEARRERDDLNGDYQRIIREVLACHPRPASERPDDDQLEPPWEVIARVRADRDALALALQRAHSCATQDLDGNCDGCFVSEALASPGAARVLREVEALRALETLTHTFVDEADDARTWQFERALGAVEQARR